MEFCGRGEFDEFDLLELVLADHAADILAVAAGFGAEAGGVGAEAGGELGLVEGLVPEEVGDGDFGGGDEPMVAVLVDAGLVGLVVAVEEVGGEFGEAAGAEEGFGVDHVGRQDFGVAVLAGVEVEHEVGDGALEAGSLAIVDDEAGAGDFGGAFEVEDAEAFADFPMGEGGEVEGAGRAPGFFYGVGALVGADGDDVLGEVGDGLQDGAKLVVGGGGGGFEGVGLGFELGELGGEGGGVAAFALELAEVGGELVALGFEGFGLGDGVAAAGVDGGEIAEDGCGVSVAGAEFLFDEGQVGPDKG